VGACSGAAGTVARDAAAPAPPGTAGVPQGHGSARCRRRSEHPSTLASTWAATQLLRSKVQAAVKALPGCARARHCSGGAPAAAGGGQPVAAPGSHRGSITLSPCAGTRGLTPHLQCVHGCVDPPFPRSPLPPRL